MSHHGYNSPGPQNHDAFGFTLQFEHILFTIIPAAILIATYPVLVYRYTRKPVIANSDWFLYAKLACAVSLLGLQVGELVLWTKQPSAYYSNVAIIASSLSCVAVCCMVNFLYVEHIHALRPSALLSVQLTLGLILDAAKARSCLARGGGLHPIGSLAAAAAALKGIVLLLEELPKKTHVLQQRRFNANATSGFWIGVLFPWINKTLFAGYRNIIETEDLAALGPEFSSSHLSNKFAAVWAKSKKSPTSHCLMKAMLWSLFQPFCAIIFPRLCLTAFVFSEPFLARRIIIYIEKKDNSANTAYGLIGATALIYLGIAVSHATYVHFNYRFVTLARGVLVSQILAKSLKIPYSEANKSSARSNISTDIDGLVTSLLTMHNIWVTFIEIGIGTYLLTTIVGRASLLVALPLLVSTVMSLLMGKRLVSPRKAWNDKTEYRVSQTASLLTYTKGIKILALESPAILNIQNLRVAELNQSKNFRMQALIVNIASGFAQCATPVIVIAATMFWAISSRRLNTADAFTSLIIISILTYQMIIILRGASVFAPSLGFMQPIQDFLLLEEREDRRTELKSTSSVGEETRFAASLSSQPKERLSLQRRGDIIINAERISIQSMSGSSIIHQASFSIQRSTLTVITGPVTSGKSVLLKALLGEVLFDGVIQVDSFHSPIAYCDQVPWVRNVSIRENIVGEQQQSLDQVWYEAVLDACLLSEDLLQLPEGDETLAGSNGMHLSDGQNQRIAIARAVYSQASIMIFDDVFSGLEVPTSATISSRLFGSSGLLQRLGITVIMVSHSLLHASLADKILFLDGAGNIDTEAAPKELPCTDVTILAALRHNSTAPLVPTATDATNRKDDALVKEKAAQLGAEEAQEDRTLRRKADNSVYSFYFQSTKPWVACFWLFIMTVAASAQPLPPIYFRVWLEAAPNNNLYFIRYAILSCVPCLAVVAMFLFLHLRAIPESANNLHEMLIKSVMGATISFLTETDTSVLLNRFSQDMSLIAQELPRALLMVIVVVVGSIISTTVVASGARYMVFILPIVLLAVYIISHFYLRASRQLRYLDLEAKTPLYDHVTETAAGLQSIRAFGLSENVLRVGITMLDVSQKPFYYMFCIEPWQALSMNLVALVVGVTLVSFALLLPSSTSPTAIGLALFNLRVIGKGYSEIAEYWTAFETYLGAVIRIRSFIRDTPQESDTDGTVVPNETWPQSGHIAFSNVTATYSSTDVPTPVMRNVSFDIYAGQKVLILGRTGSGKSSLILTILNFLDYKGFINIDGADIAKMPRHILRSRITTITQNTIQLDGTLRYNLLPFKLNKSESEGGQTAYDSDVMDVLSRVRLWEHIVSRGGLDAKISDLGLSTSQLQLMNIARGILHNRLNRTKIILMDEPTSSLDLATEGYIQGEVFSELFSHCTVIMVARSLETVRQAELSVVMEMADGMIRRVSRW